MKSEPGDTSIFSATAFLLAGPLIWAGHILFVYGPQSALCAFEKSGRGGDGGISSRRLVTAVTDRERKPCSRPSPCPKRPLACSDSGPKARRALSYRLAPCCLAVAVACCWPARTALMLEPCAHFAEKPHPIQRPPLAAARD